MKAPAALTTIWCPPPRIATPMAELGRQSSTTAHGTAMFLLSINIFNIVVDDLPHGQPIWAMGKAMNGLCKPHPPRPYVAAKGRVELTPGACKWEERPSGLHPAGLTKLKNSP